MQPLKIKPTQKSLSVELKDGELNFSGCSINNDPKQFFTPVMKWVEKYGETPAPETIVNVRFEYIDSASVKSFYEVLRELKNLTRFKKLTINWYFDFDDPEILELGEIIQSRLSLEFNFVERKDQK